MAKDDGAKYKLDMAISLDGMVDVPEDKTNIDVFVGFLIGMIQRWAEGKGGMSYQEHKTLGLIRTAMLDVVKVKETSVVLGRAEMKFLNKALDDVTTIPFGGNEMMLRVGDRVKDAFNSVVE